MARVNRQRGAFLGNARHAGDVGEIELGVHALRVHVERHCHDVDVAAALAVAEETAFDAVRTGHDGKFCSGHAGAAVVVRVHGQHDMLTRHEVAVHPLDLVGEHVGGGVLHGGRQVDDDLAIRAHAPGVDGGLASLQ